MATYANAVAAIQAIVTISGFKQVFEYGFSFEKFEGGKHGLDVIYISYDSMTPDQKNSTGRSKMFEDAFAIYLKVGRTVNENYTAIEKLNELVTQINSNSFFNQTGKNYKRAIIFDSDIVPMDVGSPDKFTAFQINIIVK